MRRDEHDDAIRRARHLKSASRLLMEALAEIYGVEPPSLEIPTWFRNGKKPVRDERERLGKKGAPSA